MYYLRILSFDVALGAAAMAFWAARLSGVALPWQVYVVLAATVAFIYTADHLYDAHRIGHRAHTVRHRFHQHYFRELCVWAFILFLISFVGSLYIPRSLWLMGALLAGTVAAHFALAHYLPAFGLHKELRIAVLYAVGVSLPAWVQGGEPTVLLLYALAVGLWAYCNLLTMSYFEHESDLQDGHFSVIQLWGKAKSRLYWRLCLTASAIMALCIGFCLHLFWADAIVLATINIIYLSIYFFEDFFAAQARYRYWADGAFLLPWILIFT